MVSSLFRRIEGGLGSGLYVCAARVSARRGLIFHKWQRAGERISLARKIDISMDALSPTVIANLIREQIEAMIDMTKWRKREAAEQRNRALLDRVSQNWAKVEKVVR